MPAPSGGQNSPAAQSRSESQSPSPTRQRQVGLHMSSQRDALGIPPSNAASDVSMNSAGSGPQPTEDGIAIIAITAAAQSNSMRAMSVLLHRLPDAPSST